MKTSPTHSTSWQARKLLSATFLVVLFSIVAAPGLQAALYMGTIDGIVTSASASYGGPEPGGTVRSPCPWYVGEHLTGSYSYTSPTTDGTFSGFFPSYGDALLSGAISTGLGFSENFEYPLNSGSVLVVHGGVVTSMDLDAEFGPINTFFFAHDFILNTVSAYGDRYACGGTMTVSSPSTVVPEPSTFIAGALLLIPFGFSGVRFLPRTAGV